MSKIKVCLRAKPGPVSPKLSLFPQTHQILIKSRQRQLVFGFSKVFDQSYSQQEIFDQIDAPLLVQGLFNHQSSCLFVYGQTGAGKTFTMQGGEAGSIRLHDRKNGIAPRLLQLIFESQLPVQELSLSFIQIYNEQVYDLLAAHQRPLKIRNNPKGISVQDCRVVPVYDLAEAMHVYNKGSSYKTYGRNSLNKSSSRSHSILSIMNGGQQGSKILLVDLAGSQKMAMEQGRVRLKESIQINKSLFCLRQVISSLYASSQRNSSEFVNFRDSKLTALLRESLVNSRCIMIACISPSHECLQQTLQTIKYASMASKVRSSLKKEFQNQFQQESQIKEQYAEEPQINRLQDYIESIKIVKQLITNNIALKSQILSLRKDKNTSHKHFVQPVTPVVRLPSIKQSTQQKFNTLTDESEVRQRRLLVRKTRSSKKAVDARRRISSTYQQI